MSDAEAAVMAAGLGDPRVEALDLGAFSEADLANIALQRSAVLYGLPLRPGQYVRAWTRRDDAPLAEAVAMLGADIARRAAASILAEFDALAPVLDDLRPGRIADIGCGYGFFGLFAADATDRRIDLIDIEATAERHFGFARAGAGYASLAVARRFLVANGVEASRLSCRNPTRDGMDDAPAPDLAVSFLSCGFHYPTDDYLPFFARTLAEGGRVILDLRQDRASEEEGKLARLGRVTALERAGKRTRVLVAPA